MSPKFHVIRYEFKGYILHPRKGTSYGRINVERVIKGNGKVSQNINFKRGLSFKDENMDYVS